MVSEDVHRLFLPFHSMIVYKGRNSPIEFDEFYALAVI